MKDGRIEEAGKHNDLMEKEKEYAAMIQNYYSEESVTDDKSDELYHTRSLDELSVRNQGNLWMQDEMLTYGMRRRGSLSVPELNIYCDKEIIHSLQSISSVKSDKSPEHEGMVEIFCVVCYCMIQFICLKILCGITGNVIPRSYM
jgi:hypothetical protein